MPPAHHIPCFTWLYAVGKRWRGWLPTLSTNPFRWIPSSYVTFTRGYHHFSHLQIVWCVQNRKPMEALSGNAKREIGTVWSKIELKPPSRCRQAHQQQFTGKIDRSEVKSWLQVPAHPIFADHLISFDLWRKEAHTCCNWPQEWNGVPSRKRLQNYGKTLSLVGKSNINGPFSMANCYSRYQRVSLHWQVRGAKATRRRASARPGNRETPPHSRVSAFHSPTRQLL